MGLNQGYLRAKRTEESNKQIPNTNKNVLPIILYTAKISIIRAPITVSK